MMALAARGGAAVAFLPAAALVLAVGTLPSAAAHATAVGASEQGRSVSSVQKVIQMLTDMSANAKKGKQDEEVAFAKFTTWCSQEMPRLAAEIQKNADEIDLFNADIGKLESDVATLGEDIAGLSTKAAKAEADLKAQAAMRAKNHESFQAESGDYAESVDALERAIAVLQKQAYDRAGGRAALLQLSQSAQLPEKAKSILAAFLDGTGGKEDPDYMAYEAPEANAYEFQSGSIVELLQRLRDDFKAKLGESQKEEMNSKHAHEMLTMDLTDTVENAKKGLGEKTVEKERKAEAVAVAKKQLAATVSVKAENEKMLATTKAECSEKQLSFDEKQKLRTEEIEAIEKAIEILSAPEVLAAAEQHLSLAQRRPATAALVQLAGGGQGAGARAEGIRGRLREFLAAEGARIHSQRLGLLAKQAATDAFAKVKAMIEGMITRLQEEAHADAEHEGFCDKEMGKSRVTRTELSADVDRLTAATDDGKATIAALAESAATLAQEVAELRKAMAEATELRQEEAAANAATIKDAKAAQAAVQSATAVLREFYEKALTATALLQAPNPRKWGLKTGVKMGSDEWNSLANPNFEGAVDWGHKEGMQTFGEVEQGQQDEENGVLALLEVIESDFATLEANTGAAETESQRSYGLFTSESKRSIATKERKIKLSNADKASAEAKLQEDTADLKATQDRLLAADRYHAQLVPQCIDQGMTFEERTKRRAEEIESLKRALEILSGEDIAL